MAENCPKSCGKCDKVTTTTEIVTPPPITTTKPNPVDCKDLKDNCAYWKGEGHCDSEEWGQWMAENCPVSCDKCATVKPTTTEIVTPPPITTTKPDPVNCEDTKDNCNYWLGEGYCTSEEWGQWMAENCAKSCDKCGVVTTTTELLTPPPLTTTTGGVVTTTSVTPPPNTTTRPTTRRQCEDNDTSCVHWKIYCNSNQYVKNNCKNTCDSC